MPALVSAGLEVVIRHWYVGYCALDLSCFPFGHFFSFFFLFLRRLSLDGVQRFLSLSLSQVFKPLVLFFDLLNPQHLVLLEFVVFGLHLLLNRIPVVTEAGVLLAHVRECVDVKVFDSIG